MLRQAHILHVQTAAHFLKLHHKIRDRRYLQTDGGDIWLRDMGTGSAGYCKRTPVGWLIGCLAAFSAQTGYIVPQEYEIYSVRPGDKINTKLNNKTIRKLKKS